MAISVTFNSLTHSPTHPLTNRMQPCHVFYQEAIPVNISTYQSINNRAPHSRFHTQSSSARAPSQMHVDGVQLQ